MQHYCGYCAVWYLRVPAPYRCVCLLTGRVVWFCKACCDEYAWQWQNK